MSVCVRRATLKSSNPLPHLCQLNSKPFIMADHPRLPPQFYDLLDTDDTLLSNPTNNKSITTTNSWSSFASSDSVLSSPVASEVGSSTETEIDPDEDFMAELTRQMANFMFQDDDELEKVVTLLIKLVPFW